MICSKLSSSRRRCRSARCRVSRSSGGRAGNLRRLSGLDEGVLEQSRVADRGQVDEDHARLKLGVDRGGDRQGEPRLPHPWWSCQREQANLRAAKRLHDLPDLATDR
jgi:hypothetical protein